MAVVLDALASYVLNMLAEMTKKEIQMLFGGPHEIGKMDEKLEDLKKFLADADRRSITDNSVQGWVRELKEAMYDATDILDLCHLKVMEQGGACLDAECFNPLLFCMRNPIFAQKIASRIKKLNQRLHDIKDRSTAFSFINLGSNEDRRTMVASSRPSSRETSGEVNELGLVGEKIEENTRNLVEILTKEEATIGEYNRIMVFAIVGVGGIGKTTLAQKIFNDNTIQHEFTKKMWLSVNQNFNESELLRRAIIEAKGDHQAAGNTKAALERTLKDALMGHKALLVMDDVWDHRAWADVLETPLVHVLDKGSRVLVTTRHDRVARGMKAVEPYNHVDKLDPDDAWSLLNKQGATTVDQVVNINPAEDYIYIPVIEQVVGNVNDERLVPMLRDIGMEIIEKCDGLPLAVKVMGGLLRQKRLTRVDWENVLHNFTWPVSQLPEELNYAIYLSYEDLHASLKPCFLYCSLLPKSTVFFVDDIISMWISEGLVHGTSGNLEEIGKEYYDELIQRNLMEPNISYINQSVCNMHDVVRSFAQYMARDEALVAHNSEIDITDKLKSQKFIRLSVETKVAESRDLEWGSLQTQISLRTLISVGHIKIKRGGSLLSFSRLRILHLDSVNFDALAESLNQLKHLRYLSIENSDTYGLPANIGRLKFLQHISLLGCQNLVKLPGSIRILRQLRLLKISGTSINTIPGGFGSLTSLRKLYGFPAHMVGDWCSLEELGPLSRLMELDVRFMENVSSPSFAKQARLGEKVHLSYLSMSCTSRLGHDGWLVKEEEGASEKSQKQIEEVFDELCPPPCLESLDIKGYFGQRLPRWMMPIAPMPLWSLRILTMDDLACCMELPNGLCLLPALELLQIVHAPAIKRVGLEFLQPNHQVGVAFPRLHELNFDGMVEWEEWEWEKPVKAMHILEVLILKRCKLGHIPCGLPFHARNLRKVGIYDVVHLKSLDMFDSIVHLEVFRNNDLEIISNLPKLQKLVIVMCPKIKVLKGLPELQRLNLEDYDMKTLPRYLQDVNPKHLLLDCTLLLLTSIAAGHSSSEPDKFSHIEQVNAYADDKPPTFPIKRYAIYIERGCLQSQASWPARLQHRHHDGLRQSAAMWSGSKQLKHLPAR
ncbi:unnamed protein product [Urochloa decumbens]|uniref:Uncharacterized protein n=1 Tax=Urochloa decumbens TaxID=240449 RepID=A0ABC8ZAL1_9POAL